MLLRQTALFQQYPLTLPTLPDQTVAIVGRRPTITLSGHLQPDVTLKLQKLNHAQGLLTMFTLLMVLKQSDAVQPPIIGQYRGQIGRSQGMVMLNLISSFNIGMVG